MTTSAMDVVDTRDMIVVHKVFRREFRLVPGLVRGTAVGDVTRASTVAAHVQLMNQFLHMHHTSEDRVLWPKLLERAPKELEPIVTRMQTQHEGIHEAIDAAERVLPRWRNRPASAERDELAGALERLHAALEEHLAAEEQHILPLARRWMSAAEWRELGDEAFAQLPKNKLPLVFGMLMYDGEPEVITGILALAPVLPRLLMPVLAPRAFARYARRVHGTAAP
jgi:hemerythrin-like domain-containing protein